MYIKFTKIVFMIVLYKFCEADENSNSVRVEDKKFVCYYGTWSTYRQGNGKFDVENIDPFLCTHVVYSFIGITQSGHLRIIDPYLDLETDWGRGNIKKFNNLKLINPQLKTLVAVGGWNEKSYNFSVVANDPVKREIFAEDAVRFVKQYKFDGFDLDWEYPAQRDGNPETDKIAFIEILKVLRQLFDQNGLILTAAVASAEFSASASYDIPKMAYLLDLVHVMAYDLHGPWDKTTGLNSPLYCDDTIDVTELDKQMNVNSSIHYWIERGFPKQKLILGIPIYGRTFQLKDQNDNKLGAEIRGAGRPGIYTNEPGMIGFNEFCEMQMQSSWVVVWNEKQASPHAYLGDQWVTYDNVESVAAKVNFINNMGLGGAMIWSIETDDFRGLCGKGKFPVITKINQLLNLKRYMKPPPVSLNSFIDRNRIPVNYDNTCFMEGSVEGNPNNCGSYFVCSNGRKIEKYCALTLKYDSRIQGCNWESEVEC